MHMVTVLRNLVPFPRSEFELRIRPVSDGYVHYIRNDIEAFEWYMDAVLYCNHWPHE